MKHSDLEMNYPYLPLFYHDLPLKHDDLVTFSACIWWKISGLNGGVEHSSGCENQQIQHIFWRWCLTHSAYSPSECPHWFSSPFGYWYHSQFTKKSAYSSPWVPDSKCSFHTTMVSCSLRTSTTHRFRVSLPGPTWQVQFPGRSQRLGCEHRTLSLAETIVKWP